MPARYRVTVHHVNGGWEELFVWTTDAERAIEEAHDWIEWRDRRSVRGLPTEVEELGEQSDPHDLNVAMAVDAVRHLAFSSAGESLSVPGQPNEDEFVRATRVMRQATSASWVSLRDALLEAGIDTDHAVLGAPVASGDEDPPSFGVVIDRRGRVVQFELGALGTSDDAPSVRLFEIGEGYYEKEVLLARRLLS